MNEQPPPLPGAASWPPGGQLDDAPLPPIFPAWARRHPWTFSFGYSIWFGAFFAGLFRFAYRGDIYVSTGAGVFLALVLVVFVLRRIDKPPLPRWATTIPLLDPRRQPIALLFLANVLWIGLGAVYVLVGVRNHRLWQVLWAIASVLGLILLSAWSWRYRKRVRGGPDVASPSITGTTNR